MCQEWGGRQEQTDSHDDGNYRISRLAGSRVTLDSNPVSGDSIQKLRKKATMFNKRQDQGPNRANCPETSLRK